MNRIIARSRALHAAADAVDRLHRTVDEYGSDSDLTGQAQRDAQDAVAVAKQHGITTTHIGQATRR